MDDKLLDIQAVAEYLDIPKSRVYDNWRAWGLPFFKIGQQLRMRPNDFETWISRKAAA